MIGILNILFLISLAIWGYWLSRRSSLISFYWLGLGVKIVAGIAVGLLYSRYYDSGDSWVMMAEGIKIKNEAFASFRGFVEIYIHNNYEIVQHYAYVMQPRGAFMTKILAPVVLVTNNNYWLTSAYLSLFSFAGFWVLANTLNNLFKNKWVAVIPTLFFPSIVFWSSGVLKESVAIGSLALLFAFLTKLYIKKHLRWHEVLFLLVGFLLVMHLKYYYAAVLAVIYITLFVVRFILPKQSTWYIELGYVIGIFVLVITLASFSHPNFWPSRFMSVIVNNYYQYAQQSKGGNMVVFTGLEPTILSLLINSPKALFSGLFSPLWIPTFSFVKLAAIIENWLLIVASVYAVLHYPRLKMRDNRLLFYVMILFIITMAVFLTFSSPNYGTLVRYRIGYLMIFVIMLVGVISSKIKTE